MKLDMNNMINIVGLLLILYVLYKIIEELSVFRIKEKFTVEDNKLAQEIVDFFNGEDNKRFLKYSEILDKNNNIYIELAKKSTFDYFKQKEGGLLIKDVLDKFK